MKFKSIFIAALFVLFVGSQITYAKCYNINLPAQGTVSSSGCGILTEEECLSGTINSNPPYTIQIVITDTFPHPVLNFVKFQSGETVITSQNGNQIFGTNAMSTDANGETADLMTITGGTGIFADSTGVLILDTNINRTNGTFDTRMKGEICIGVN